MGGLQELTNYDIKEMPFIGYIIYIPVVASTNQRYLMENRYPTVDIK